MNHEDEKATGFDAAQDALIGFIATQLAALIKNKPVEVETIQSLLSISPETARGVLDRLRTERPQVYVGLISWIIPLANLGFGVAIRRATDDVERASRN